MQSKAQAKRENLADLIDFGLTVKEAQWLQDMARQLHRYYEIACNQGLSATQEGRQDRSQERITLGSQQKGFSVYHESDPRGWPILLSKTPIVKNDTLRPGIIRVCPY